MKVDEKFMKREVMIWLSTLIIIFTIGLIVVVYFMTERMYSMSKDKEYKIVGNCFQYVFLKSLLQLKNIAEHSSYDVESLMVTGKTSEIPKVLQSLIIDGEISGAVVETKYGKIVYSSFEKIPKQLSGRILMAIRDKRYLTDITKINDEISAVAVVPVFHRGEFLGAFAITRNFENEIAAASEKLGGDFSLISWEEIAKISEELKSGVDYIAIRKDRKVEVYYNAYNGKYFIHWSEPDERGSVIRRSMLVIALFNIPLFIAILYFIMILRKKITSNFIDPLKRMIDALDDLVATTSSSSQELAASSQELAASTKDLEDKGRSLSEHANGMLQDLERTEGFSENVAEFAGFLEDSIGNLEKLSGELSESMQEIHEMGGLIQQIGERIVVLSINASIESSRDTIDRQAIKALADEIGNLSETTTERVSKIFASLQGSQEKLDEMNNAMRSIMSETKRLAEGAEKLLKMIRENKGEFEKVSDIIEGMFTSIEEVNFASQNLAEAATELSQKSYEIQRMVDEIVLKHSHGGEYQKEVE